MPSARIFPPQMRYVFDFGEDSGGGRELLGGKGVGLAEMTQLGIPVPDGFTITTEACRAFLADGGEVPRGSRRGGRRAHRRPRAAHREGVRRRAQPIARLRPLRCGDLDAGDDGLDPQPRAERRRGRGARGVDRKRALRPRFVSPARPDVRRGRRRRRRAPLRAGTHRPEDGPWRRPGRRPHRRRPARARRHVRGHLRGGDRRAGSRRIPATSCAAPTARSSTRGTRRARRCTAARTTSPTTSAPP